MLVTKDFFVPINKLVRFPRRDQELFNERKQKNSDKRADKLSKDKGRKTIGRKAAAAEKKTTRDLVKMTRNSGRTNKDGDHVALGSISMDTKLQTGNINPVVNLAELAKIRNDARRAGNPLGVLVLRNKFNTGVVAIAEEDWATLLTWLDTQ